ncbi:MAG: hypothetical protein LLH30_19075 [Candidatus Manganitrophus sp. SA1]|nr:hypothetical protein [Candidatus Manganitrophus morganii]
MLHSSSGGVALNETAASLFSEVARVISNEIDLLEVSSRCRVNPTTLRKILQERPVSPPTERKIRAGLGLTPPPGAVFSRPSRVDRLYELYRLYQEKGTLAAVGRTVGLSRERVRQLLVRGTEIGLFEYRALPPSGPSREKILEDYKNFLSLSAVAGVSRLSMASLRRLCRSYRITREELEEIRNERRRIACIDLYLSIVQERGHHPTTTELSTSKSGRSLRWQICRSWGSIEAFRSALRIPSPSNKGLSGAARKM